MTRSAAVLLTVLAGLLLIAACGTARRGAPLTGPHDPPNEQVRLGQQTFATYCHGCHPGGTAAIGPAINNKPLPGFAIRRQVRWGLGQMPSFSEEVISDEALDGIVAYLVWLRRLDPREDALRTD